MARPNFFIVGAPKCGTTAWMRYLSTHPDIYFSPIKEPHYFCTDFPRFRRFRTEDEYLSLFAESGNAKAIGEGSVRYLHSEDAPGNIKRFNPAAKIIIFVRDQEDYLPSQHNHMFFNKQECIADFETAWRLSSKRDSTNTSAYCTEPKFLDYARLASFSYYVERYFGEFPEEQIRVFHFDQWTRSPRDTYAEILRFLDLPDDGRNQFPKINQSKRRRTRWLWMFEKWRPYPLKVLLSLIRKGLGVRALGFGKLVGRLDTGRRPVAKISEELRSEIARQYENDKLLLQRRIWRPNSTAA